MSIYRQNAHAHSVGWNTWHFEWCTKYRYKIFKQLYLKNLCLVTIREAAKRYKIKIMDIEVDVDHIHVIVSIPMTMAPTKALHLLKGFSSKLLFGLVPNLRKRYPKGHLWRPGKFAASIGHITVDKAKQYLEAHHAKAKELFTHLLPNTGIPACGAKRSSCRRQPLGRGGCQFIFLLL